MADRPNRKAQPRFTKCGPNTYLRPSLNREAPGVYRLVGLRGLAMPYGYRLDWHPDEGETEIGVYYVEAFAEASARRVAGGYAWAHEWGRFPFDEE